MFKNHFTKKEWIRLLVLLFQTLISLFSLSKGLMSFNLYQPFNSSSRYDFSIGVIVLVRFVSCTFVSFRWLLNWFRFGVERNSVHLTEKISLELPREPNKNTLNHVKWILWTYVLMVFLTSDLSSLFSFLICFFRCVFGHVAPFWISPTKSTYNCSNVERAFYFHLI